MALKDRIKEAMKYLGSFPIRTPKSKINREASKKNTEYLDDLMMAHQEMFDRINGASKTELAAKKEIADEFSARFDSLWNFLSGIELKSN